MHPDFQIQPGVRLQKPAVGLVFLLALMIGVYRADAQQNPAGGTATNAAPAAPAAGSDTNAAPSTESSGAKDDELDMSKFLDSTYGFIPLAVPITEPAVGYGGAGGLVFINSKEAASDGRPQKPDMFFVGGGGTENGTWAAFAGHTGSCLDGKVETQVFAGYGSINLNYYGVGESPLNDNPVRYNLQPTGGVLGGRYRLGHSSFQAGLGYNVAEIKVSFDGGSLPPNVNPYDTDSRIAAVTPSLIYDTRDNFFTPTKGIYADAGMSVYNGVVGSDRDFEIANLAFIFYLPLSAKFFFSANFGAKCSFDDVPFYSRPFISLRGVEAFRYLGENAGQLELEGRWQFWKRFSLIGFAGTGIAWNDFGGFHSQQTVVSGGTGIRYELAHKYGLHMGLDVGVGPNESIVYLQFGSAWFRP